MTPCCRWLHAFAAVRTQWTFFGAQVNAAIRRAPRRVLGALIFLAPLSCGART